MLKKILILFFVILVAIQFIRPEKNINPNQENVNNIPENILSDLKIACYDCHSNNTVYPWYSNIQPVAWWLNNHIVEGKQKLNFDEKLSSENLEEIVEVLEENEMPLFSYTIIHRNAKLNDAQKKAIMDWAMQPNANTANEHHENNESEEHE